MKSFPITTWAGCLLAAGCSAVQAQTWNAPESKVSLRGCIETALLHNRALQIERINPEIAQLILDGSYSYYDPVFFSQFQRGSDTDTGGFDPADFSRDAIYSADSETASGGLTGFLPGGGNYSLSGSYAHSDGTRNFQQFDSYKLGAGIFFRQPLLKNFWTDQGRTQIRINRKNLKITELGVVYAVLDTINQVEQAYYELLFTHENLKVRIGLLGSKEATLAGIRRQVEVGKLTVQEEKLALSEVARVQAELISASNTVVLAENVLKTLLAYAPGEWQRVRLVPSGRLFVVPAPLELSESWQSAFACRPDLVQLRQEVERVDIDLKFRRNQLFPSLDLIAGYGRRGADAMQSTNLAEASFSSAWAELEHGDAPNHSVGFAFSTPLSRSAERAGYKAVRQLREQATLRLHQKEELIMREVSDAIHTAKSAFDRARATRRAADYAKDALEAEEQKLAAGKSSLFFVFQLQSDLADAQSAEVRARADYNKALAQLYFAEGSLLERNSIVLKLD